MYVNRHKKIYWGELRGGSLGDLKENDFLYGTILNYYAPDHIYFENPMMPSGTKIHEWASITHYQGHRATPSLPLLKKGQQYHFSSQMEVRPQNGVYFKIRFLDRYGKEINTVIEKQSSFVFTFPEEAYHYQVQLLSAGIESFDFHWISIEEEETQDHV